MDISLSLSDIPCFIYQQHLLAPSSEDMRFNLVFFFLIIYLTMLGLSCDTPDLHCAMRILLAMGSEGMWEGVGGVGLEWAWGI